MQRLRDLELADLAGRAVDGALLHEQAAVEQHADGLDRVERDALGAGEDLRAQRLAAGRARARRAAASIAVVGERLEIDRREVALPRSPRRAPLEQLRPGERDDEERMGRATSRAGAR